MRIHLRIHPWVLWWFVVGFVCGLIAMVNILARSLTRGQEDFVLILGMLFWSLGGLVCWATEGVQRERHLDLGAHPQPMPTQGAIADDIVRAVINRQWQRFATRDAVGRFRHTQHLDQHL